MCLRRYCRARISSTCSLARPRSYSRGTIAPFPSPVSSSQSGWQRFHSIWTLKCQLPVQSAEFPLSGQLPAADLGCGYVRSPNGEAARAALIELCASLPHSDFGVQARQDIRAVSFDRISKKALVEALHEIWHWDAWRGPNDQGNPHPLTSVSCRACCAGSGYAPGRTGRYPASRAVNVFRAIAARILNKRGPTTVQKTTHRHIRAKS